MREAIRSAMTEDPRVFLMGEDVADYGGTYAVSRDLHLEFGRDRIRNTPLAESGFVGAGMSGGQCNVPLVVRMATGAGRQLAAQHSHSLEGWFAHIPGLRIVVPATVDDARWMLPTALADPDPVLVFEHAGLYATRGTITGSGPVDIDTARVRRPGSALTLMASGASVAKALAAAELVAAEDIDAEVIDLRTLRPLDTATLVDSVSRTHRGLVGDEGWRSGGISAEISARLTEICFRSLAAPIGRVCGAEVPIPCPAHLEAAAIPQVDDIVEGARAVMTYA